MNTKKKLNIVAIRGFFGQSIPTECSINVSLLLKSLKEKGYEVDTIDIEDLSSIDTKDDTLYLFGSHQNNEIKKYIDDLVSIKFLAKRKNTIPRPELILAHENKGVQVLLASENIIGMPKQRYLLNLDTPKERIVVKHVGGAGSKKVFLAEPQSDYTKNLFKSGISNVTIGDIAYYIKSLVKNSLKWKHFTEDYKKYNKKYFRHVWQEYIKSPGFDYKVLVFFDKCYVLKRGQRRGDFRSSGSGLFEFIEPDVEIIKYALKIRQTLDSPYISLDIIKDNQGYKCIEFQCTHFGPYTKMYSPNSWKIIDNVAVAEKNNTTLESDYAYAIDMYLSNKLD